MNKKNSTSEIEPQKTHHAFQKDTFIYRFSLISLSIVAILGMGASIYITIIGLTVPDTVSNMTSAAIGAIAGLLSGARSQ